MQSWKAKRCHLVPQATQTPRQRLASIRDFTQHKDEERKKNYIARHKPNQNWNDLKTAGAWAKNLLWNKPTISASIKDMERRFRVDIKKK